MKAIVYVTERARAAYSSDKETSFLQIVAASADDMVYIDRKPEPNPGEIIIAGTSQQGFVHIYRTVLHGIMPSMSGITYHYGRDNSILGNVLRRFEQRVFEQGGYSDLLLLAPDVETAEFCLPTLGQAGYDVESIGFQPKPLPRS